MITDVHAHLFHPSWYPAPFLGAVVRDFLLRSGKTADHSRLAYQLGKMLTDKTGESTIRIMDQVGIERKVILIIDWGLELGESEKSIREIHRDILGICREFSDRLVGFAGVDPRRQDATALLQWAFDDLGARGLKLHPTCGWSLSDPRTGEVVALAAERNLPVMIHVGKTIDILNDENSQPEALLDLARLFPQIPFIAGHSGFNLWRVFAAVKDMPENVYFDISGWQEGIRDQVTTINAEVSNLHSSFPGRVCFGTDSPFYGFNMLFAEKQWMQNIGLPFSQDWAIPCVLRG